MQTLKELYENSLTKHQNDASELLREAIDQRTIDEMQKALKKITIILSEPSAESLSSLHFGLQKAHKELSNILAMGAVSKWAHSMLPAGATAIGRLAAFTHGVMQLFSQLIPIVDIVKGSIDEERKAEWDSSLALDSLLDSDATSKLLKILVKAMSPPSGLSYLTVGLPYVKDETLAAEILDLSYNNLLDLSKAVQKLKAIRPAVPVKAIAADVQAFNDDSQEAQQTQADVQDVQGAESEEKQKAKLILPQEKESPQSAPSAKASSNVTVQEFEADFNNIYDDLVVKIWGEKGMTSKQLKEFKPKLIRQVLVHMMQKGLLSRQTRK